MQHRNFIRFLTLPETLCLSLRKEKGFHNVFRLQSTSSFGVCSRCACKVERIYDHVWVAPRDEPIRSGKVLLRVRKRRWWCHQCGHKFRETLPGIRPFAKTTERLRRAFALRCVTSKSVSEMSREWSLSTSTGYGFFGDYASLEVRKWNSPLPTEVGMDEHSFRRIGPSKEVQFVSVLVDHKGKKVREVALGKDVCGVYKQWESLPGRDNVLWYTIDMSTAYLSLGAKLFPKGKPIVDRFHVERRVAHSVTKERLAALRKDPRAQNDKKYAQQLKDLVSRNPKMLTSEQRDRLQSWIIAHPDLSRVHRARSEINAFYRCRDRSQARAKLTNICNDLFKSRSEELLTLRATLIEWREPILNYFERRITNARTEGFNCRCKMIKRNACGYKLFENYRKRILLECG